MTVEVSRANTKAAAFTFTQSGADWNTAGSGNQAHLGFSTSTTATAWPGVSRQNATGNSPSESPSERIAAYSNIDEATTGGTPDGDYLLFGYWNRITGAREVKPFYWGSMPHTGALPTTGSPAYAGGAAGWYRSSQSTSFGYFTADVRMSANFATAELDFTLDNFSLQNVSAATVSRPDRWSFQLSSVSLDGASFSGAASTGGGTWSGMFFGAGDGAVPTGVAGVFTDVPVPSTDDPGHSVTGSFGAAKQ